MQKNCTINWGHYTDKYGIYQEYQPTRRGDWKWHNIYSFKRVPVLHTSFHIRSFQWHIPSRLASPRVNNRKKKNTRKK